MAESELTALYHELGNLSAKLSALKDYAGRIDEKADRLGIKSLGLAVTVDMSRVSVAHTMTWIAGFVNASLQEAADYGFVDWDDELRVITEPD